MSDQPSKDFCITIELESGTFHFRTSAPFSIAVTRDGQPVAPAPPDPKNGFLTTHRVLLQSSEVNNERSYSLRIDEGEQIPLQPREFSILKMLVQKMMEDGAKPAVAPDTMGWVASDHLRENGVKPGPGLKLSSSVAEVNEHTRGIYSIREKLKGRNITRELLQYKAHAYRLSTAPANLKLDIS